jgi:hypothetical protein
MAERKFKKLFHLQPVLLKYEFTNTAKTSVFK